MTSFIPVTLQEGENFSPDDDDYSARSSFDIDDNDGKEKGENANANANSDTSADFEGNFEEFLLSSYDSDLDPDEFRETTAEEDVTDFLGVEITHIGELASPIEHKSKYGGTFGNIKISSHVLLNQCGTLLTRKNR